MQTLTVSKNQIEAKVGVLMGFEGWEEYKNVVTGYMDNMKVLICTNLNQEQWDRFCNGELTKNEIHFIL
jgi:hypothetical protein